MKVAYKKSCFNQIVARVFVLAVFMSMPVGPSSALASPQTDDPISRGDFIAMMANYQPENGLFPQGQTQLSKEKLYLQTVQNMSRKGFRILDGKLFHEPLEPNEFVQLSYIFADGPPGKNLFEQKLFLKKAGIIDSADVGLTTGYDGNVYQTHQEENVVNPVRLATPIYMHDRIKTELLAKATFTFDDKSTLTLAEDSTVNITKHIYDPEKDLRQTIVHLSRGTVRFVVTKGKARGSMFKVVTPTAIAGVRGTEFVVSVDENGKTTFLVLEGQIETKPFIPSGGQGKTFLVSAGESHSVSKNGKATRVMKAPPGLLKSANAKTSKPTNTFKQTGLSKKMARSQTQKLTSVMKAKNSNSTKTGKNNKSMKAKVLKLANHTALFDAKTLDKKFEKIRGEKSSMLAPRDPGKSNAKGNAKGNAKANAKSNAKANAKSNAKANAKSNAKSNAKQVAQEKGKGKGKP